MLCLGLGYITVNHCVDGDQTARVCVLVLSRFWVMIWNKFILSPWDAAHGSVSSGLETHLGVPHSNWPCSHRCIVEFVSSFGWSCFWWNQKENLLSLIHPAVAASLRQLLMSVQFLWPAPDHRFIGFSEKMEILIYLSKYLEKGHTSWWQSNFFPLLSSHS